MTKTDHLLGLLISATLSIPAFLACGSEEDDGGTGNTDNDTSMSAGSGGAAPDGTSSGGTSGGGGSGGASGAGGASGGGSGGTMADPYECFAGQEDPNPGGTATAGADCCNGLGTCTPRADITDESQRASLGHSDCTAMPDLACAPKASSDGGASPDGGALASCHIAFGSQMYEGRCMPDCFLLGDPSTASLISGDCEPIDGVNVMCAPCYDPSSGDSTGACEQGGDMPTEAAPEPFAPCGALSDSGAAPVLGTCLPTALVEQSGGDPSSLPPDVCATGELCVPTSRVEDVNSCFERCTSIVGPGACVPTYIVEFNSPGISAALGQISCQPGETCAPCLDPNMGNAPTGACSN